MRKLVKFFLKKKFEFFTLLVLLALNSFFVFSQPIVPYTITGYVFLDNGEGAPEGVPVIVNNTHTGRIFTTEVVTPPVPELRGIYSLSIEGSAGHEVVVQAYNDTHYGETVRVLSGSFAEINVSMNLSRPAELIVNITSPLSNSLISPNSDFNVSVNVTSIVDDAQSCEAVIFISDTNAMDVKSSNSIFIPSISKDDTVFVDFELESFGSGSSDLEVVVTCVSDGVVFEGNNKYEVFNITVEDDLPPIVSVVSPLNNSVEKTSNDVSFVYVVSDDSSISACRLIVNGSVVDESFDVPRDVEQSFVVSLSNGFYEWEIECDDPSSTGSSGLYNLEVSVFAPVITSIDVPDVINLNPGSTKSVVCNVSVEDGNGAEDIDEVSAFLHLVGISDFSLNDNFVYFDTCTLISQGVDSADFSCSFDLVHYANNGSWLCNATAVDNQGLTDNNYSATLVDELYAINLSALFIDYGEVPAGSVSSEQSVDVFNVGNMPLSVFVKGYGSVEGDGLSMVCENEQEILVDNQRFSDVLGQSFDEKSSLSSSFLTIINSLDKQVSSSVVSESTFWQVQAPPMDVTSCEGTVVFSVSG